MASRHEIRARHTEEKQRQNPQQRFKRNMAVVALVGMTATAAIGVFAGTYYIDEGDIVIEATESGTSVTQGDTYVENDDDITITQHENVEVTDNIITIIADENETVEVTIKDINIEATNKIDLDMGDCMENYEAAISIEGAGDVVLELDGDNVVKSGFGHAGVETAGSGMLTVQDENNDGNLNATGGRHGAGIGGNETSEDNNITINGGTVKAKGGTSAAGIGGGGGGNGNVTISGGTVEAKGGGYGAGIGGGFQGSGDVTITGGTVYAQSSSNGAGIGSGSQGDATIAINGGMIDAKGGKNGAGIGGGFKGSAEVTITAGTITATSGRRTDSDLENANAIGAGGYRPESAGGAAKTPQSMVIYDGGTIIEQPYGWDADGHTHSWEVSETANGMVISLCVCGSKKTEMDVKTENFLLLTTLSGIVQPYEQSMADGRAVFAAPAQDAILTGSLGALAELKAQGAQTLVFRTQQCETSMSIDKILAAGSEDDVFALTHKGAEAVLTVEGRVIK